MALSLACLWRSCPRPSPPCPQALKAVRRALAVLRAWLDTPAIKLASQYAQFALAIAFVALYVYATYSPPPPDSLRYQVDLLLCAVFAVEYVHRMLVRCGGGGGGGQRNRVQGMRREGARAGRRVRRGLSSRRSAQRAGLHMRMHLPPRNPTPPAGPDTKTPPRTLHLPMPCHATPCREDRGL